MNLNGVFFLWKSWCKLIEKVHNVAMHVFIPLIFNHLKKSGRVTFPKKKTDRSIWHLPETKMCFTWKCPIAIVLFIYVFWNQNSSCFHLTFKRYQFCICWQQRRRQWWEKLTKNTVLLLTVCCNILYLQHFYDLLDQFHFMVFSALPCTLMTTMIMMTMRVIKDDMKQYYLITLCFLNVLLLKHTGYSY